MIPLHWHPEIELIYAISGELEVTVSQEKHILRKGDILFINPAELHSYASHCKEVQYHAAVFESSLLQFRDDHFFEQNFTTPIINGVLRFPRLLNRKHHMYGEIRGIVDRLFNRDINSRTMIFADLIYLFCMFMENGLLEKVVDMSVLKKAEDIKFCIKYMEENYNRKITLGELADLLHMSPNYFCDYFKKQTGLSPFTQLNYIRIQQASKLLCRTERTVAEIAEECGYENVNYFIRKFKEIRDCTPAVYRRKAGVQL